jgi:hypothetical protein
MPEFDFIPQSWTYEFGYRSIIFPAPCGQGIFVTPVPGLSQQRPIIVRPGDCSDFLKLQEICNLH